MAMTVMKCFPLQDVKKNLIIGADTVVVSRWWFEISLSHVIKEFTVSHASEHVLDHKVKEICFLLPGVEWKDSGKTQRQSSCIWNVKKVTSLNTEAFSKCALAGYFATYIVQKIIWMPRCLTALCWISACFLFCLDLPHTLHLTYKLLGKHCPFFSFFFPIFLL